VAHPSCAGLGASAADETKCRLNNRGDISMPGSPMRTFWLHLNPKASNPGSGAIPTFFSSPAPATALAYAWPLWIVAAAPEIFRRIERREVIPFDDAGTHARHSYAREDSGRRISMPIVGLVWTGSQTAQGVASGNIAGGFFLHRRPTIASVLRIPARRSCNRLPHYGTKASMAASWVRDADAGSLAPRKRNAALPH